MFGRRPLPTLLAVSAVLAAGASSPGRRHFVGKVEGSDAYIGLVGHGKEVTGYVCDGNQVSVWFGEPDLRDGRAELVSAVSLLARSRSRRTGLRAR